MTINIVARALMIFLHSYLFTILYLYIYIYVGLKSGLRRGAFNEFSLELTIVVIQRRVY